MSEQEERMTGTIAQACSQRGNLTMTLLLKLACYAEPHTCTVQTLRSVQSVQNKLPSPTSPPTSPTHRSANPEKKKKSFEQDNIHAIPASQNKRQWKGN